METGHLSFYMGFWATHITWLSSKAASILDLGPCALAWAGSLCGSSCPIGSVPQLPSLGGGLGLCLGLAF